MSLYIMLLVLPWYVCIQRMRRSGEGGGGGGGGGGEEGPVALI